MQKVSERVRSVNRGQKVEPELRLAHLPEFPSAWDLDADGRPAWISSIPGTERAPWAQIVPRKPLTEGFRARWSQPWLQKILDRGPIAMPAVWIGSRQARIPPWRLSKGHSGRPPLWASEPEVASYAAWLKDVGTLGRRRIAQELEFGGREDSALNKVERYLDAGRAVLAAYGVLPWSAWNGAPLRPDWTHSLLFQQTLTAWYEMYVVKTEQPAAVGQFEAGS
jgi:hypothetical protein